MNNHLIKKATDLSPIEIATILHAWRVDEWKHLSPTAFRTLFRASEFHLLTDARSNLLSAARINLDFKLDIKGQRYMLPELAGFVAIQKGKGYGANLLHHIVDNLKARQIEALGFCEKALRPFYERCAIPILYNQAQYILEPTNNEWQPGSDDDILNLTLSSKTVALLDSLSANQPGYLIPF